MTDLGNDAWEGSFVIQKEKDYLYSVRGYVSDYSSWRHDLKKKIDAQRDVRVDLRIGSALLKDAAARSSKADAAQLRKWSSVLADTKNMDKAITLAMSDSVSSIMLANMDPAKSCTYLPELRVSVERKRAIFSSWYEPKRRC